MTSMRPEAVTDVEAPESDAEDVETPESDAGAVERPDSDAEEVEGPESDAEEVQTPEPAAVAPGIRMLENDRAAAALGMTVESVKPGHAVISMRIREDMLNGFDKAHGGVIFALADTAFAAACNEDDRVTVSAGAEISYLRPGQLGQLLTATAVRRHRAGRSGIYDVQVRNETEVIAEFRGHSRIVVPRAPVEEV